MTQPYSRQKIENLWDRATPVGPLLDAYRAEVLREAAEKFTALAENAHMEALSNDDIGHASGLENAAAELRCMADEAAQ